MQYYIVIKMLFMKVFYDMRNGDNVILSRKSRVQNCSCNIIETIKKKCRAKETEENTPKC